MAGRREHHPWLRGGVCLRVKWVVWFLAAWLIACPVLSGFAADPEPVTKPPSPAVDPAIYLIPDQATAPVSLGMAITPDQINLFTDQTAGLINMNPSDKDHFITHHADVSTVVRVALNEFDCLSGLNLLVEDAERTIDCCTKKLMLTGELNLNPNRIPRTGPVQKVNLVADIYKKRPKPSPSRQRYSTRILRQFEIDKLRWNTGFRINAPGISFTLGIGDAFMIYSTAGDDFNVGAMIKLSI